MTKSKIFFLFLAGLFGLIFCLSSNAVVAPQIYITDLKTDKISFKAGEEIKGNATFWNYEKSATPDVGFNFSLLSTDKDGKIVATIDTKKGEAVFTLMADQKLNKDFIYLIPENIPSGSYVFRVQSVAGRGETAAWKDTKITIDGGSGSFVELSNNWILKDTKDPMFTNGKAAPNVGPSYNPGEKPEVQFDLKNGSTALSVYPQITVFKRNAEGDVAKTDKGEVFQIKANEKSTKKLTLPEISEPESYLAEVKLYDSSTNKSVSNPTYFRWVISGQNDAKITSVTLDKNVYASQEVAKAKIVYAGPADVNLTPIGATLSVKLFDDNGNSVGEKTEAIDFTTTESTLDIPVSAKVENPKIDVQILRDGQVLDEYSAKLNGPVSKPVSGFSFFDKSMTIIWTVTAIIILALIIFAVYMFKKKKTNVLPILFLILASVSVFLLLPQKSLALTQVIDSCLVHAAMTVSAPYPYQQFSPGEYYWNDWGANVKMNSCTNSYTNYVVVDTYLTEDRDIPFKECGYSSDVTTNRCSLSPPACDVTKRNACVYDYCDNWYIGLDTPSCIAEYCGTSARYWDEIKFLDQTKGYKIQKLETFATVGGTGDSDFPIEFTVPTNWPVGTARIYFVMRTASNHIGGSVFPYWQSAIYYQPITISAQHNECVDVGGLKSCQTINTAGSDACTSDASCRTNIPTVNISGSCNITQGNTFTLHGNASDSDGSLDILKTEITLDGLIVQTCGAGVTDCAYTSSPSLSVGSHNLYAYIYDLEGNVGGSGVTTVCTVTPSLGSPPTAVISCNPSGCSAGQGSSLELKNNSTDPDGDIVRAKWYVQPQGQPDALFKDCVAMCPPGPGQDCPLSACNTIYPSTGTAGNFTSKLIVYDSAGNTGTATNTFAVTPSGATPTVSGISSSQDYCDIGASKGKANFFFTYNDSAESQSQYWIQVANNPGFSSPEASMQSYVSVLSGTAESRSFDIVVSPGFNQLSFNRTYYWRIQVQDAAGNWSGWSTGSSFTTPTGPYPVPNFTFTPASPTTDNTVIFTNTNLCTASPNCTYNWTMPDGTYQASTTSTSTNPQVKFSLQGTKAVKLKATDSFGHYCEKTNNVVVTPGSSASPIVSGVNSSQDYCDVGASKGRANFLWTYSDPNGKTQKGWDLQVSENSGFTTLTQDTIANSLSLPSPSSEAWSYIIAVTPTSAQLAFNKTYYWRIKVQNVDGTWSDWSTGSSFTTPVQPFPEPGFTFSPASPTTNDTVAFTNTNVCNSGTCTYNWTMPDGTYQASTTSTSTNPQVKFFPQGTKAVKLRATDSLSHYCEKTNNVVVTLAPSGTPTISGISSSQDYCDIGASIGRANFFWTYNDPNGKTQKGLDLQVSENSGFTTISQEKIVGSLTLPSPTGESWNYTIAATPTGTQLAFNKTYYWRIKVQNSDSTWSSWYTGSSFTTPVQPFPEPGFTFSPASPTTNDTVAFTNTNVCHSGTCTYDWTMPDGTYQASTTSTSTNPQVKFNTGGTKAVILKSTDNQGHYCTKTNNVVVTVGLTPATITPVINCNPASCSVVSGDGLLTLLNASTSNPSGNVGASNWYFRKPPSSYSGTPSSACGTPCNSIPQNFVGGTGTFEAKLEVSDTANSNTQTTTKSFTIYSGASVDFACKIDTGLWKACSEVTQLLPGQKLTMQDDLSVVTTDGLVHYSTPSGGGSFGSSRMWEIKGSPCPSVTGPGNNTCTFTAGENEVGDFKIKMTVTDTNASYMAGSKTLFKEYGLRLLPNPIWIEI